MRLSTEDMFESVEVSDKALCANGCKETCSVMGECHKTVVVMCKSVCGKLRDSIASDESCEYTMPDVRSVTIKIINVCFDVSAARTSNVGDVHSAASRYSCPSVYCVSGDFDGRRKVAEELTGDIVGEDVGGLDMSGSPERSVVFDCDKRDCVGRREVNLLSGYGMAMECATVLDRVIDKEIDPCIEDSR